MQNILEFIGDWVKHDLELEHALSVQDLRLIRLGFSHTEIMNMTLDDRSHYLRIGNSVKALENYESAFLSVEAGTLSSGFIDKNSRRKLYGRWDKQIKKSSQSLDFSLNEMFDVIENATGDPPPKGAGSASKHSPVKKSGVVNFADKMAAIARMKDAQTQ